MKESHVQNMNLSRLGLEEVEERLEVSPLLYVDGAGDREFAQAGICSCEDLPPALLRFFIDIFKLDEYLSTGPTNPDSDPNAPFNFDWADR